MTDLGLTHALNANTNVDNEHASAAGAAVSDGALHASEDGATYDGSAGADAAYDSEHASGSASAGADASASGDGVDVAPDVDGLPELGAPEVPAVADLGAPELPTDLPVSAPALPDAPALPELPVDTSAADGVTGDVGVSGGLEGWLDAMGALMAEFAASLGAAIGL